MKTIYTYNSLDQINKSNTPDGGVTQFWFNNIQQPRYSQTAEQVVANKYSYSKFDNFGRPIEVGVFTPANLAAALSKLDDNTYPIVTSGSPTYDVIKTIYHKQTVALNTALGWSPRDLNNRIAAILEFDVYKGTLTSYDNAIFYNYDIHGNVKQLLTDVPLMGANNRYKIVDYQYDVYSGKVLRVSYQKDKQDQFLHRYSYDDDNRLLYVQTSTDGIKWDMDAQYYYYLHGPLARTEFGEDKVQGLDYAYTLHGYLKGINGNSGVATRDLGKDGGTQSHKNRYVAQDAMGYSLTYFNSGTEIDYKPIVTPTAATNWLSSSENAFLPSTAAAANLYNGNVRAMMTSIRKTDNTLLGNVVRVYKHDQLNRLKEAQTFIAANQVANNSWTGAVTTNAHFSSYSYYLNGNIASFNRRNDAGAWIDQLNYGYNMSGTEFVENRLYHLDDDLVLSTAFTDDVDDMGSLVAGVNINHATLGNNYVYDASGRLIKDKQEQIETIVWNVRNKVSKIVRTATSTKPDLEFRYNAMGQRIVKIVKPKNANGTINTAQIKTTYYSIDAKGNLMATYSQIGDVATTFASTGLNSTSMFMEDFHLYGVSRLGTQIVDQTLGMTPNVSYIKSSNRASAIVGISSSTFTTGNYIQYRVGSTILNDPFQWNTGPGFDANVQSLINEVNKKTVTTDVSASLWFDKNASGTIYIEFSFGQPGNWLNQTLSVYTGATASVTLNNTLTTGAHMARQFSYGTAKGSDILGAKRYELGNHLGSVLSIISDRKWGIDDGVYNLSTGAKTSSTPDKITDYYQATIMSYSDYDPFGTQQSGRIGGEDYRFGFQGQEADDEIKGEGNSLNYEYRMHDPRTGRFFAVDPLAPKYPHNSPYAFSENKVVAWVELEGLETGDANAYAMGKLKALSDYIFGEAQEAGEVVRENIHVTLDILGCVPVVGELADGVNAIIYTFEGDYENAAISTIALIPIFGESGKILKYTVKWGKKADAVISGGRVFATASKAQHYAHNVYKYGQKAADKYADGILKTLKQVESYVYNIKVFGQKAADDYLEGKITREEAKAVAGLCFAPNTIVKTNHGDKEIQNISLSDSVWSYNLTNSIIELKKVEGIFITDSITELLKVSYSNQQLFVTPKHRFFANSSWIEARILK
ncbi:RHS repeat-associated core domain-containing protein [Fluviicola sp.]|uniref:RHS repeat-associated core domain-containing protein n=1 Tax=Fluviicola sp. TaxID=1917219 RepID=UPI003D26746F